MIAPTISQAAALTRQLGVRGVLVIALGDLGLIGGASYGTTRAECRDLGALLDAICDRIERGELRVWSSPSVGART